MGNHAKEALVAALAVTGLDTLLDTGCSPLRGRRRDVDDLDDDRGRCCSR
jgi:hypothetical protein